MFSQYMIAFFLLNLWQDRTRESSLREMVHILPTPHSVAILRIRYTYPVTPSSTTSPTTTPDLIHAMSGKPEQGWMQHLRRKSNQSRQNQDNKTSKNRVNCAAPVATEVVADPGQSRSPGQTATSQHPDVGTDASTKDSEETLQNPFL